MSCAVKFSSAPRNFLVCSTREVISPCFVRRDSNLDLFSTILFITSGNVVSWSWLVIIFTELPNLGSLFAKSSVFFIDKFNSSLLSASSINEKCGETPASIGNCRSNDWQNAWMVCIFSLLFEFITKEKRLVARVICGGSGVSPNKFDNFGLLLYCMRW